MTSKRQKPRKPPAQPATPRPVGRPPKGARSVRLKLRPEHIEIAERLGEGNKTRGVEIALDQAAQSI